jgi:hypothetical protein
MTIVIATTVTTTTIIIEIEIMIMMVMVMVLLINNSSDSDFECHFLNCYFLKSFCMIRPFFFQFHPLIFSFLEIRLHDFYRFDASSLMTWVMGLKS